MRVRFDTMPSAMSEFSPSASHSSPVLGTLFDPKVLDYISINSFKRVINRYLYLIINAHPHV